MFSFERSERPFAKIISKDKNNGRVLFVHEDKTRDDGGNKYFDEIKLPTGTLEMMPNIKGRDINYVTGSSGCGKSTIIARYAKNFKKAFKSDNEDVILFRPTLEPDENLDYVGLTQIPITEKILSDPITVEELENPEKPVLVIFDDTDTIQDKKLNKAIVALKDSILETGRKKEIYTCIVSHLLSNYKESRIILNELTSATFYPCDCPYDKLRYFLNTYFGTSKDDFTKIMNLPTRWVTIYRKFPKFVMYETGAFMLNKRENDKKTKKTKKTKLEVDDDYESEDEIKQKTKPKSRLSKRF